MNAQAMFPPQEYFQDDLQELMNSMHISIEGTGMILICAPEWVRSGEPGSIDVDSVTFEF